MVVTSPQEQVTFLRPRKRGYGKSGKGLYGFRRLTLVSFAQQGELGWQMLSKSEKTGLQLGTAVGTGSYGIVREAYYRGYKVIIRSRMFSARFILCPTFVISSDRPSCFAVMLFSEYVVQSRSLFMLYKSHSGGEVALIAFMWRLHN